MASYSELNSKYFIDNKAFNCPFCGLRNTTYTILAILKYDLNKNKSAKVIFVRCNRCGKVSIHFASCDIQTSWGKDALGVIKGFSGSSVWINTLNNIDFLNSKNDDSEFDIDIDSKIYHSIPSSSFTMDERIPRNLRDLFDEAQECKKANLKTGASACLRKLVYTLLSDQLNKKHKKTKQSIKDLGYEHYSDCIKALKEYHPNLSVFIAPLEGITGITSDQVHEDSWAEISSQDLGICLEAMRDLLNQIYVQPAILKERENKIREMSKKASTKKKSTDK
ncbi:MAG: hypothetical protein J6Y03_05580 [Alphaproteobacteria bacterium]|nr:hypothetical protein [Alphaproteobacteria bacterium]